MHESRISWPNDFKTDDYNIERIGKRTRFWCNDFERNRHIYPQGVRPLMDRIIRNEHRLVEKDDILKVSQWMVLDPVYIRDDVSVIEAARKMHEVTHDCMPVVNKRMHPVGMITAKLLLRQLVQHTEKNVPVAKVMTQSHYSFVSPDDSLLKICTLPSTYYFVTDKHNKLIGTMTRDDLVQGLSRVIKQLNESEHTAEILNIILESAYEGIVVVDERGIIIEFNEAYSRFIGVDKQEAIGRPVQDVIDNTNLHNTVKTGMPERGVIQYIHGQPMIVHRIPLWHHHRVVGAIGMLIFEGVTELYKIYERLQKNTRHNMRHIQAKSNNLTQDLVTLDQIIGVSASTARIKGMARKVAKTNATVLMTGESGTGKEMYAQSIHRLSPFASGPFVSLNCAAIPEYLFETELFGYDEGAFTGAKKGGKKGKFELAQDGTLFLDEIGEMPLPMQTKLLRVLQEKEFERVGGNKKYKINTRIIAATNRDLKKMVAAGHFREDLYYRINVIELNIPPLRQRKEDIPPLVAHYLNFMCHKYETSLKQLTPAAMQAFMHYDWYGNIRELVNVIEKLVVLVEGEMIDVKHLPDFMVSKAEERQKDHSELKSFKNEKEKELIVSVLKKTRGNKSKAAKELGIHRTTLYQKLKKYGLI